MPTKETQEFRINEIKEKFIPTQIKEVALEQGSGVIETFVENIASDKIYYPHSYRIFAKGQKEYYIGLNHRGKVFKLYTNPIARGKLQYNMGIHVQIDGGENLDGTRSPRDQFTSPLPEKGDPTIIHCLSMIVFFDEEDFIKFKTKYEGIGLQNAIFELCKGGATGVASSVNGLHSTLFNLSSHEYYTITKFGVTQIPQINYEDVSARFGQDVRREIQDYMSQGHDVLVLITKKSDIMSQDILSPTHTYDQPNTVVADPIVITKEQRLNNIPIVPEKSGFVWRIYPNKALADNSFETYKGDTILEAFDILDTGMEEKQKDEKAEYEKQRTDYNKKTFNFIVKAATFIFGSAALEKYGKKIFDYLRKFFSGKAKKAAAKTAAAAFKQAAKSTVWTTIKTAAVKVAKAIATSIATAGVTKILKGLFSKAVALFI